MDVAGVGCRLTDKGVEAVNHELEKQGLSRQQLAKMSSCSRTSIYKILNRQAASERIIHRMLTALGFDSEVQRTLSEHYPTVISLGTDSRAKFSNLVLERDDAVQELSEATLNNVQAIASAQIKILDSYHREVLLQAKNSFRWALISSGTGFFFFIAALIFLLNKPSRNQAIIPLVSGTVIEVIAGVNFYLYGRATAQLSSFHQKLDQTQRFLLANSICESLEGEAKQSTRSELVKTVSSLTN